MLPHSRVPLAWRNLIHRPVRFGVYLAGIGFAVLLMFVELGFWFSLLDSVVSLIGRMKADLVVVNKAKYTVGYNEPFRRSRLERARSVAGVAAVSPLYVNSAQWKHSSPRERGDAHNRWIRIIAFDLSDPPLNIPEVAQYAARLQQIPGTAIMDTKSKWYYNRSDEEFTAELDGHRVTVIGSFELGTDFTNNGNLIMSEQTYASLFAGSSPSGPPLDEVEVGLITLIEGADVAAVQYQLQTLFQEDGLVMTRAEYAAKESAFWERSTPTGFIFLLALIIGFVVGIIICSQILSTDVSDHIAEYATLKAIGYRNSYLTRVILGQAVLLSVLAFIPGVIFSKVVYVLLESWTGLPMQLTLPRSAAVLLFTVLMCVLSGFFALYKAWFTDPAEVF
jgi:putative ABC transport system permease protein